MKKFLKWAAIGLVAILAACNGAGAGNTPAANTPRFQIVSSSASTAWRIDTITGNVSFCQGASMGATCMQATDR